MLRFAEVTIGSGLVLACARCADVRQAEPQSLESIGDSLRPHRGCDGVWLTGMEPFEHPRLPQVIVAAREAGLPRIGLRTNAGALSVGGNAAGVLSAGVTLIEFVLLGHDPASHDTMARRAGLFDAATGGLRAYRAAAEATGQFVYLAALVPVCRHNVESLPLTVAAAAAAGATSITLDTARAPRDTEDYVEAALETAAVNLLAASVVGGGGPDSSVARRPWDVVA